MVDFTGFQYSSFELHRMIKKTRLNIYGDIFKEESNRR